MPAFVPYHPRRPGDPEMRRRALEFYEEMQGRRSVRDFSADPVPRELIELAVAAASTAPSGAHRQPWRFVAISDPQRKQRIRLAAEHEERQLYQQRMSDQWREALAPLGVDWRKPYLETVPWLVVVFEENYRRDPQGHVSKNYYVRESVGIACGLFIVALHHMGLATLTHTPSPMGFLTELCERPENERPYILFPVGYPARDALVPDLTRKPLEEVLLWLTP